jgi:hypothetical protein
MCYVADFAYYSGTYKILHIIAKLGDRTSVKLEEIMAFS